MTDDLNDIRQRINAAEAYAADAERTAGDSGDPMVRLAVSSTMATIATAQLLHLIATQADASKPVGRCTEQTTLTLAPNYTVTAACILGDGHGGAHQDGPGRTWHRITPVTEPDQSRCRAERDGSRCVRNTGHPDRHFGAGAEWEDACGDPFGWNPDVKCSRAPGHPSVHSGSGCRWGNGYCAAVYPGDHDRWCTRDEEHTGNHQSGTVEWEQPAQGIANPAAADVKVRRLRYMAARIEAVLSAISEERLSTGDTGVLGGIAIALRNIADDLQTEQHTRDTVTGDDDVRNPAHHIARHLEAVARAVREGNVTSRDVLTLTDMTRSLGDTVTGVTPSPVTETTSGTCTSNRSGLRCERPAGHAGMHYGDGSNWNRSPANPDRVACMHKNAGSSLFCVLPETHDGPHVDDDFHTWGMNTYAPCEASGVSDGAECCERQAGHRGMHRQGKTLWG